MQDEKKIVKYIHAIQPGTECNLCCSYCYVQNSKEKGIAAKFKYPVEHIVKALSKERVGGTAFITYVGGGETLIPKESVPIIQGLLENGHVVNIVSNLAYSEGIDKIVSLPRELLDRTCFSVSLHYVELINKDLKQVFVDNINKLKKAQISFHMNMTIGEDYLPYLEEIKEFCLKEVGFLPIITFAVDSNNGWRRYPCFTDEIIENANKIFEQSSVVTYEGEFLPEYRNEFCYIGDWGFVLNIENGDVQACFQSPINQNIFKDLSKPIKYEALGTCCATYCAMGPAFQAFGFLPEFDNVFPTFAKLYKNIGFYGGDFDEYLNNKLSETNKKYSPIHQWFIRKKRYSSKKYRRLIKAAKGN